MSYLPKFVFIHPGKYAFLYSLFVSFLKLMLLLKLLGCHSHMLFIQPVEIGVILKPCLVAGFFYGMILGNQIVEMVNAKEDHIIPNRCAHIVLKQMGQVGFVHVKSFCNAGNADVLLIMGIEKK